MNASSFATLVLGRLVAADERTSVFVVRARGKEATIGYLDDGEWVPLFRIAGGSAAYNVANLFVRHRDQWQPTLVRGTPTTIAEALLGPLRFLWEFHVSTTQPW